MMRYLGHIVVLFALFLLSGCGTSSKSDPVASVEPEAPWRIVIPAGSKVDGFDLATWAPRPIVEPNLYIFDCTSNAVAKLNGEEIRLFDPSAKKASATPPAKPDHNFDDLLTDLGSPKVAKAKPSADQSEPEEPPPSAFELALEPIGKKINDLAVLVIRPDGVRGSRFVRAKLRENGSPVVPLLATGDEVVDEAWIQEQIEGREAAPASANLHQVEPVYLELRGGKVYPPIAVRELDGLAVAKLGEVAKATNGDRYKMLRVLSTSQVQNAYYQVDLLSKLTGNIALQPIEDGEPWDIDFSRSLDELAAQPGLLADFEDFVDGFDADDFYVSLIVRATDEDFRTFRKLRRLLWAYGIHVEYAVLEEDENIEFGFGGHSLNAL